MRSAVADPVRLTGVSLLVRFEFFHGVELPVAALANALVFVGADACGVNVLVLVLPVRVVAFATLASVLLCLLSH